MFAVNIIDFEWINSVKLIRDKSKWNVIYYVWIYLCKIDSG